MSFFTTTKDEVKSKVHYSQYIVNENETPGKEDAKPSESTEPTTPESK